ncbi:MAG: ATP-dependent DNA helicase RecG [Firmicutes bacterium]|nr:ATP-dependent DNA helicase RecG [Bacillota bacterium]
MDIENIKGIGSKTVANLKKLNINTIEDLITYYPFRYDVIKRSDINNINDNDNIIIDGICENIPSVFYINRKLDKMNFRINTNSFIFNVVIYNRGFLKSKLKPGTEITVMGKYDKKHNLITAYNLELSLLNNTPRIEAVYHSTYGLTSKQIEKYISKIKDYEVTNYIPDYLMKKYDFIDKKSAIKEMHNPTSLENLKIARIVLKYEELFLFMLKMNYLKMHKNVKGLQRNVDKKLVDEFINDLPFTLTTDQMQCVNDIYNDLVSEKRMNRLVQGDVGSGKTVVSFIAIYINYLSGYQSALMAPTEILAEQHFININKIFEKHNIKVELLTGKTKNKKKIYEDLENNKIDCIIGTHALFTDNVKYNNLGLVITDEQHRFGVNQRSSLKNKGITPDILYMSATPIPRTYALTLYGDMDVSNIKTMPNGRKEVITLLRKNSEIKDVLTRMYEELKQNHQIYVIAPLIEESDKINLENVNNLEEKMNQAFSKVCKTGVLHGKMSSTEKDEIMNKFKNNEISILISTTVIEVGVDVKNATMIVIFDSYRFGLSALHQLRGRVGRSSLQSYCILISDREKERLNILTTTSDGFKVSEEDFLLRGSGDLFGIKQSGDMSFKIADLKKDYKILLKAKDDSLEFLENGEYENSLLHKELIEKVNNLS